MWDGLVWDGHFCPALLTLTLEVWSGHSCPLPLTFRLPLILGGAAVHRCDSRPTFSRLQPEGASRKHPQPWKSGASSAASDPTRYNRASAPAPLPADATRYWRPTTSGKGTASSRAEKRCRMIPALAAGKHRAHIGRQSKTGLPHSRSRPFSRRGNVRRICTAVEERRFQRRVKVPQVQPGFSPSTRLCRRHPILATHHDREGHGFQPCREALQNDSGFSR